jgi:hypothetical protein
MQPIEDRENYHYGVAIISGAPAAHLERAEDCEAQYATDANTPPGGYIIFFFGGGVRTPGRSWE